MKRTLSIIYVILLMVAILGLGVGFILIQSENKKQKDCKFKMSGKVVSYKTKGTPHYTVEYVVSGETYTIENEYKSVHKRPKFLSKSSQPIYLDTNNVLHIILGESYDANEFLKKIAPMNSRVPVYYNDQDPEQAYIRKVPSGMTPVSQTMIVVGFIALVVSQLLQSYINRL